MIGEALKYHRMMQGLTQRDVSMAAGLSAGCIGTIEYRNKDISLQTAAKIAKALDISIDELCKPVTREQKQEAIAVRNKRLKAKKELRQSRQAVNKKRYNERQKFLKRCS